MNHREILYSSYTLVIERASQAWSGKNPQEVFDWCFSEEGSRLPQFHRGIILSNIMEAVGFHSPLAKEYLDKAYAKDGSIPDEVIFRWAMHDPSSAQEWVERMGNSSVEYKNVLLRVTALSDPAKAAGMIVSLPEEERARCILNVLIHTQDKEPAAALSFLLNVKPVSEITEFDLSCIRQWSSDSPDQAETWIQQLPSSSMKDTAIDLYVQGLGKGSLRGVDFIMGGIRHAPPYKEACTLIDLMENPEKKQKTLTLLFQNWKAKDPEEFLLWRKQAGNQGTFPSIGEGKKE